MRRVGGQVGDRRERVVDRGRRERAPPARGVSGRVQSGLHLAGQRLLRDDDERGHRRALAREQPRHVADRGDRAADRAGHLRAADARRVRRVDLGDAPAGRVARAAPSRAGSRCGGRAGRGRAAPRRRAARIGPRSCSRRPGRAPDQERRARGWRSARAAARRPRVVGRRRPSTRSASPASTGSTTSGRSAGSIDASASQNATIGAVAASSPACAAEPKPRRGSRHHDRAVRARRRRPSRRSSRCRRRSRGSRRGSRDEHPGQRRRLVEAREDDVDRGRASSHRRAQRRGRELAHARRRTTTDGRQPSSSRSRARRRGDVPHVAEPVLAGDDGRRAAGVPAQRARRGRRWCARRRCRR